MEDHLSGLVSAIRTYLAGLKGPGIAEVLRGIDKWHTGNVRTQASHPDPQCGGLDEALSSIRDADLLRDAIITARSKLPWVRYDLYPAADIGPRFPQAHAFASLVGGDAPIHAEGFELGLFLIAPRVLYRDHHHAAPELYVPLTGPHRWRFGVDQPWDLKPAHAPVWNEPWAVHATITGGVPFLCIFAWTRDVNVPAKVAAASDWAVIEASL